MNEVYRKNISLTIGILLPVFVILIIFITNFLSKNFVADPRYNIIYTNENADHLKLVVVNGRLVLRVENNNSTEQSVSIPKIFLYNVTTKETKQLLPDDNMNASVSIPAEGFKTFVVNDETISRISKLHTSPDGYKIEKQEYRGLASLLWFSMHSQERSIILQKASRSLKIETIIDYPHFFAWVLEK